MQNSIGCHIDWSDNENSPAQASYRCVGLFILCFNQNTL